MLYCVLLSPVILQELQEHSPYQLLYGTTQQVMPRYHWMNNAYSPPKLIITAGGDDYAEVNDELLTFSRGATRVCRIILIMNDAICESNTNEIFFSELAYVSGVLPITITPSTAQVVIDDTDEPECKY